jgi:hypothetical protein
VSVEPPGNDEFATLYAGYVAHTAGERDAIPGLDAQTPVLRAAFEEFGEAGGDRRYATGQWSVREVAGHLTDFERIFAHRALCVARGDATPLPGFDENAYVASAGFGRRPLEELVEDLLAVRRSTVRLFAGLDAGAHGRRGVANGSEFSVRAAAYIILGHARHHLGVLRDRYR